MQDGGDCGFSVHSPVGLPELVGSAQLIFPAARWIAAPIAGKRMAAVVGVRLIHASHIGLMNPVLDFLWSLDA